MSSSNTAADSPSIDETTGLPTDTTLDDVDVFVIDHEDLDELVAALGGPSQVPEHLMVCTNDGFTRNSFEFNLIAFDEELFDDRRYGTATQLHSPGRDGDTVVDARKPSRRGGFADFMMGLL